MIQQPIKLSFTTTTTQIKGDKKEANKPIYRNTITYSDETTIDSIYSKKGLSKILDTAKNGTIEMNFDTNKTEI